jgi:hypothetical protein
LNYLELKQAFRELKCKFPKENLTAHITFTEDSFDKPYSLLNRTYRFSSDNKAFYSRMGGYSIFADCLDGGDQGIRLDWYMTEEGNTDGWKVEDCYILEQMRDVAAIPHMTWAAQEDGTVCYFFGDTCIRAYETTEDGKIQLEPVRGDQAACGEWTELPLDRVYGYCTLLARHLNGGSQ